MNLVTSIPIVSELFDVHCKVGKGAFSSVFLATLKSSDKHKKFALKQLIPTCHPERIKRELQYLQKLGYVAKQILEKEHSNFNINNNFNIN